MERLDGYQLQLHLQKSMQQLHLNLQKSMQQLHLNLQKSMQILDEVLRTRSLSTDENGLPCSLCGDRSHGKLQCPFSFKAFDDAMLSISQDGNLSGSMERAKGTGHENKDKHVSRVSAPLAPAHPSDQHFTYTYTRYTSFGWSGKGHEKRSNILNLDVIRKRTQIPGKPCVFRSDLKFPFTIQTLSSQQFRSRIPTSDFPSRAPLAAILLAFSSCCSSLQGIDFVSNRRCLLGLHPRFATHPNTQILLQRVAGCPTIFTGRRFSYSDDYPNLGGPFEQACVLRDLDTSEQFRTVGVGRFASQSDSSTVVLSCETDAMFPDGRFAEIKLSKRQSKKANMQALLGGLDCIVYGQHGIVEKRGDGSQKAEVTGMEVEECGKQKAVALRVAEQVGAVLTQLKALVKPGPVYRFKWHKEGFQLTETNQPPIITAAALAEMRLSLT